MREYMREYIREGGREGVHKGGSTGERKGCADRDQDARDHDARQMHGRDHDATIADNRLPLIATDRANTIALLGGGYMGYPGRLGGCLGCLFTKGTAREPCQHTCYCIFLQSVSAVKLVECTIFATLPLARYKSSVTDFFCARRARGRSCLLSTACKRFLTGRARYRTMRT